MRARRSNGMILALLLGVALVAVFVVGCSDDATTTTAAGSEPVAAAEELFVGTWDNDAAAGYKSMTFNADGTVVLESADGMAVDGEWEASEGTLIITPEGEAAIETSYTWVSEGEEVELSIEDGSYVKH